MSGAKNTIPFRFHSLHLALIEEMKLHPLKRDDETIKRLGDYGRTTVYEYLIDLKKFGLVEDKRGLEKKDHHKRGTNPTYWYLKIEKYQEFVDKGLLEATDEYTFRKKEILP